MIDLQAKLYQLVRLAGMDLLAKVNSVRIQPTGDGNATLLEFTTSVCKIEFLRPHLGKGFSISQVLLLLA